MSGVPNGGIVHYWRCPHCGKPAMVDTEGPSIWWLCCNTSEPKLPPARLNDLMEKSRA